MSRTIKFVFLMGLVLSLALSACGTPAPTEAPAVEAPAAEAPSTEPILTVTGAVNTELALSDTDLRGMEVVQLNAEHPKNGPTDYEGVRLSEVLAKAGVKDGATILLFVASDGYESEVPYADVEACADCLVAFDGDVLNMVMPGMSSKAWAKMVVKIEVKGGAAAEAPADIALKVTGAVASEQAWSEADVKAMKTLDVESTNSKGEKDTYTGVLITDLLALAQPNADATTVVFVADDGFTAEVGLKELNACADCILSFRTKGGFSSVLPGFEGKLQVKGVVEIQLVAGAAAAEPPANPNIILATTTSTQDSGLLDVLVPLFEEQTGYTVQTIAVGTGEALKMGEEGNADVLLVHAPASEVKFMEGGFGKDRFLVMHNDFIIVGPADDPAAIKGLTTTDAFAAIYKAAVPFVSRGDDSGTHKKEISLWGKAEVDPVTEKPEWFIETGQGMGASLVVASEKAAYILTDRATYLANKENLQLEILLEGDAALLNVYHVMTVNPEKWDAVNYDGAMAFSNFMIDPATQAVIGEFGVAEFGLPLFFPDADKTDADLGL